MECFFLSFRNVLCRFKWKHTLNRSNIIYMDLCFKNDVRENVFAQLAFMCSENLFYIIIHYESHSCSNHQWRWYGCHLSSLKSAFFDKCFTSELHIMEQKPWGHNLNTPAPQLTRKKGKKWAWLAAEESTLPILNFAQHHPDKFKKKKCIQSFPAVGKTLFKCLQGNPNLNDKLLPADWLEDLLQIRQAAL